MRLPLFALALALATGGIVLPLGVGEAGAFSIASSLDPGRLAGLLAVVTGGLACCAFAPRPALRGLGLLAAALALAAAQMHVLKGSTGVVGGPAAGAYFVTLALSLSLIGCALLLSDGVLDPGGVLAPALCFVLVVYVWEAATILYAIPRILLPAPSAIGARLVQQWPTLEADFVQTVIRAAIPGWILGSLVGFLAGLAVDRFVRLSTAFQLLGGLLSVIPILAVAPIMVLWLGFDWQSKVAVAALMTFFPMFTATIAGLAATGPTERDLMQSYAASYGQTLRLVRLPVALPFIFSALKLNVPAAMVGAMIAEFFGTPIVGLGFRIASESGRLSFDIVWAAIALASAFSLALYAAVVVVDRLVTFWHPSHRNSRRPA